MEKKLSSYIDHTILKPTTLIQDIHQLCDEAIRYNFAAVCVPPLFVKFAKEFLENRPIKVATVVGFPFGYSAVEAKVAETILAIVDGAEELDVVINITALKNNDWQFLGNELNHILPIIRNKERVIKVIIESGILTKSEIIKCCDIYGAAGVDFVKTSTGYAEKGASVEDVKLIRQHLSEAVKIKASGGISSYAFAKQLIDAGADRLGCSKSVKIMEEAATLN